TETALSVEVMMALSKSEMPKRVTNSLPARGRHTVFAGSLLLTETVLSVEVLMAVGGGGLCRYPQFVVQYQALQVRTVPSLSDAGRSVRAPKDQGRLLQGHLQSALLIPLAESSRQSIRQPQGCELPFQVVQLLKAGEGTLAPRPSIPAARCERPDPAAPWPLLPRPRSRCPNPSTRTTGEPQANHRRTTGEPQAGYFDSHLGAPWASLEGSASWVPA
ncbi:MAG: hypothetical protein OSA89_16635, partial [Mariniblastus sp.]|nr:hypothetical protein [Mariniblastus sp.]